MNYPCELIRDLLPLYHDDVCSTESRNAVEQHCVDCPECQKILDDLRTCPEPYEVKKESEFLMPIRKRWNQEKKKSLWLGLGLAIFFALLLAANTVLREWKCVPMGKDDLVVLAVYQTSDGCIHVSYDDLYDLNYFSTSIEVGSDGYGYISAYRPILAKKTNIPHRIGTGGITFDPESAFAWLNDKSREPVTRVYLGIKNDPDQSILVWENGMEVRVATAEEETEHMRLIHSTLQ